MNFLQVHELNKEIATCPDMKLTPRHDIQTEIANGKLYAWGRVKHKQPYIGAGLFRYRNMMKDKGLDQNALTNEIMEEIRWKKLTLTT